LSISGIARAGFLAIWEATALALDVNVVMRKTCIIWNVKYHNFTCSSLLESDMALDNFAKPVILSAKKYCGNI